MYEELKLCGLRVLKDFRKLLDNYPERMSVGEVFSPPPGNPRLSSEYIGNGKDQLDMAFDFSLMYVNWNAKEFYKKISNWLFRTPFFKGLAVFEECG